MGMSDRDGARQAALRRAVEGGEISAIKLSLGVRDVVGPAPRLIKAGRELLGWTIEQVAQAAGLSASEARGCERAGAASDRALCVLQLWLEGKGVRFYEPDFHGVYGVKLTIGWADERRAIRAGCALLGSPMKTLAQASGLSLARFEKVMRAPLGIVPPLVARTILNRLENEGVRFLPASPSGWAGVRLGKGERVTV